jgi:Rieske Fe-S protein
MPQGASRYLAQTDVHVIHDADGIYAVSGRCTHLGCSILRQPDGFSCPCHGARFDLLGEPVSGPAVKTLAWYKITVTERRRLVLHLDQTVEPGTRTRI